MKDVIKAVAGAATGAVAMTGTSFIVIPESAEMPWYGYVMVGALNAVIGFAIVYFAPRPSK
jgi:hypothetical protein